MYCPNSLMWKGDVTVAIFKKNPYFSMQMVNMRVRIMLSGVCIYHILHVQLWLILSLLWLDAKTLHMHGILPSESCCLIPIFSWRNWVSGRKVDDPQWCSWEGSMLWFWVWVVSLRPMPFPPLQGRLTWSDRDGSGGYGRVVCDRDR